MLFLKAFFVYGLMLFAVTFAENSVIAVSFIIELKHVLIFFMSGTFF